MSLVLLQVSHDKVINNWITRLIVLFLARKEFFELSQIDI